MNKPTSKHKAGPIEISIWANKIDTASGKTTVLKATVERRYRKSDGEWASTTSYSKADIPQVIYCLQKAYDDIIAWENERAARRREGGDTTGLER